MVRRGMDSSPDKMSPCWDPDRAPEVVASRLATADIDLCRFIDVEEGRKQSFDHTRHNPEVMTGNYGVYTGEGLLALDIDDFSAVTAPIERLTETFTVETPHGGEHRYYRCGDEVPWRIMAACGGSRPPRFPWGELYTSKYLVGPGSELIDCDKSDCKTCREFRPGKYTIVADRPIATMTASEATALVQPDSGVSASDDRQGSLVEFSNSMPVPKTGGSRTESQPNEQRPTTQSDLSTWEQSKRGNQ